MANTYRDFSPAARSIVEDALDAARRGNGHGATKWTRETFGSQCDAEHPEVQGNKRTNRCFQKSPSTIVRGNRSLDAEGTDRQLTVPAMFGIAPCAVGLGSRAGRNRCVSRLNLAASA